MNNTVLLVGSGFMAKEYLIVLRALGKKAIVIGRGKENVELLKSEFPEFDYKYGGLDKYLNSVTEIPKFAINASSINQLCATTKMLLQAGVKYILLEKPGDLFLKGLEEMEDLSLNVGAGVFIAYNRRFYSSVKRLKEEAIIDGGIKSVHFEFTEWAHAIDQNKFDQEVLKKWMISNSAHVIDTVFFLIGKPSNLHRSISGLSVIPWHPTGSIFIGMGTSENEIPFTYHSNWGAPGRWSIEICTANRRFYLKPMEKLAVQKLGTVAVEELEIDNVLDINYKPGLYVQVQKFLNGDTKDICTIKEQRETYQEIYMKMAAYTS